MGAWRVVSALSMRHMERISGRIAKLQPSPFEIHMVEIGIRRPGNDSRTVRCLVLKNRVILEKFVIVLIRNPEIAIAGGLCVPVKLHVGQACPPDGRCILANPALDIKIIVAFPKDDSMAFVGMRRGSNGKEQCNGKEESIHTGLRYHEGLIMFGMLQIGDV